jgi:hypothetical protein
MKQIKFNDTLYSLATDVVNDTATLRATIMKEDNTITSVANVVSNVQNIYVIDNGEVVAQYTGFTNLCALDLFTDYSSPVGPGVASVISIVLQNANIQQQINNIYNSVTSIEETQTTTDAAINDLGTAVDELADSQATQDLAIEDLAEVISGLEGE